VAAWTFKNNDWVSGVPSAAAGAGSIAADPHFVAPNIASTGAAGYALAAGSPALGAGVFSSEVPQDFACAARSTTKTNLGVFGP
jgi:hypothetical protein